MNTRNRILLASSFLLVMGGVTAQSALPFTFSTGTPAKADDVNANFAALNARKLEMGMTISGDGPAGSQARLRLGLDGALSLRGLTNETGNPLNSLFNVDKTGGVLATGQIGVGIIPATGAGWRMMWHPQKVAFRAGYVDGAQWDESNVGYYSWAGGALNTAAGIYSFAMGNQNTIEASAQCGMAMGSGNKIFGTSPNIGTCGVAMGLNNKVADHVGVTLGQNNTSDGDLAVAIGYRNVAVGDYSTAMGYRATTCETTPTAGTSTAPDSCASGTTGKNGAFIYGDASTTEYMTAKANNEFAVRAAGGFRFRTNATQTTGCNLPAGSGSFSCTSDKNQKKNFQGVDVSAVLRKVLELPVKTWVYKDEASGARHMGPTAQDFYKAFKLGDSDKSIGHLDQAGVAYAAIQGLNEKVEAKDREVQQLREEAQNRQREVAALKSENAALKGQMNSILERLAKLEHGAAQ